MRTLEKTYTLFSPCEAGIYGQRRPAPIGQVRCAVSRLTGEEINENDMERSRQRYSGFVRIERAPLGGFVRGMRLSRGGAEYNVLSAVLRGRLWLLSLDRVIMEGDCADA